MSADWAALRQELAIWDESDLSLPFWWRDDDAVADTPALRQLADMSSTVDCAIVVAVIPAFAERGLADLMSDRPGLIPAVHGWAHTNHAPDGQKKAEFGAHRPIEVMLEEAEHGLGRLHGLCGSRLLRLFVPPWNRVSDEVVSHLAGLGYDALSTFTPRADRRAAPGLSRVNTHIDPIDWKGSRSLLGEERLIAQVLHLLRDRRSGKTDATEPLGLLTHHLVHDAAIWSFCDRLADTLLSGPATPWRPTFGGLDEPT